MYDSALYEYSSVSRMNTAGRYYQDMLEVVFTWMRPLAVNKRSVWDGISCICVCLVGEKEPSFIKKHLLMFTVQCIM